MRCYILLFSLLILIGTIIFVIYDRSSGDVTNRPVNVTHVSYVLGSLCEQYQKGWISGDLCNRLCFSSENYSVLEFHDSNKAVVVILIGGQKLALKSQSSLFTAYDQLPDEVPEAEFLDKVLEMTNFHLQIGWPKYRTKQLLELIWPSYRRTETLNEADRRSLWALVNQEEYLTFAVLNSAKVFPKTMGTCGHFYGVEYVVPFKMDAMLYANIKSKILLHLMGTLKLFYDFLNEPLHWCDVKFDNFGLSADYPKRFMVMDADMVFTESRMQHLLESLRCKSDADCQFFDCTATCIPATGHCSKRTNDNVDVFCKKLVYELFGPFWSKANKFLAACHNTNVNYTERLRELRLAWAWSLYDI